MNTKRPRGSDSYDHEPGRGASSLRIRGSSLYICVPFVEHTTSTSGGQAATRSGRQRARSHMEETGHRGHRGPASPRGGQSARQANQAGN